MVACDYGPDGDPDVIAVAGSDTTQDVVGALVTNYNADPNYNEDANIPGVDKDSLDNILSVEANPNAVAGDEHCGNVTYHTPAGAGETLAPNGSSAGRDALKASVLAGNGCIDIARSSAGPRPVGTGPARTRPRSSTTPSASTRWATPRPAPRAGCGSDARPAAGHLQLHLHQLEPGRWRQPGRSSATTRRRVRAPGRSSRATSRASTPLCSRAVAALRCRSARRTRVSRSRPTVTSSRASSRSRAPTGSRCRSGAIPDQRSGQVIRNLNGKNIVFGSGAAASRRRRP